MTTEITNKLVRKNVLITGGAGFIGSNLAELLRHENTVISLDDYSSGSEKNHVPGVEYLVGKSHQIGEICSNFEPDIVFHLGEFSRVEESFNQIDHVIENNIIGTIEVLKYCNKNRAKLIYAGSSTKFSVGDPTEWESPYSLSKKQNTEIVKKYSTWNDMEFAIVYFYNVYGKNEISTGKFSTVIAKFLNQYRDGQSLTVVSPGTQKRNFTHVSDIVEALDLVAARSNGDMHCIGANEKYKIIEVAKMFSEDIAYLPERRGNREDAELDLTKMRQLGWHAKTNLQDYIHNIKK